MYDVLYILTNIEYIYFGYVMYWYGIIISDHINTFSCETHQQ